MKLNQKRNRWLRSKKFWKRAIIALVGTPGLVLAVTIFIIHHKQDEIVSEIITALNEDFSGSAEIKDSHISFFSNFPYISIDLEEFTVYETKDKIGRPLLNIHDVYAGFNLWTIITGNMEIKKIKFVSGHVDIVQHKNGEFNILKALSSEKEIEESGEEFHLDLKRIELIDIDLTKLNEENGVKIEAFIDKAKSKFKSSEESVHASLDTQFELNLIKDGDTTYLKHKHLDIDTEVDFFKKINQLKLNPSVVRLEGAEFNMQGSIDFEKDLFLDLIFTGQKPNFDLLIALAPEEIIPTLKSYENKADLYIKTTIKGASINGNNPSVKVLFSCDNGEIINPINGHSLKGIKFSGFFTNGTKRVPETMAFELKSFGLTSGDGLGSVEMDIAMKDFRAPDLKLKAKSEIDLKYAQEFLGLKDFTEVKGKLNLALNFHDIIDLKNPAHTVSKLNENYDLSFILDKTSFKYAGFALPIKRFDFDFEMHGHEARIEKADLIIGKSDLHITGRVEDLPAILHHTDVPIDTRLSIKSNKIDLYELTGSDSLAINEEITDMEMDFDFKASAKSFTESKYLPVGEFFIKDLHADLKHYPHRLHDFHGDILVGGRDLDVIDLSGMIDKSDFHFTGKLEHYEKWLDEHPGGDSKIEFDLSSRILQLESLFTYNGENFVPEDYRHEEFDNLHIHGFTFLHFDDELKSLDLNVDKFEGKMKVHPLRFENFEGRVHYEDEHLVVEDFHGKMGHSSFKTTLHFYLGEDVEVKKRDNHFEIFAQRLDVDELLNYSPPPTDVSAKVDHDAGFNIYTLPFTDMTYHLDIGELNYHKYDIRNMKGNLRSTPSHYIYLDHLNFDLAGGHFDVDGYFNGSDPNMIYFSPDMKTDNVDLDQLMFKFDNFGQDYLVSENLHGRFTGRITGKIHMHNDLVPKIDDSEIHMDVDVTHGRLENYSLLQYMSDYFKDKNLDKVLFDTLNNQIDIVNGEMIIPKMEINSTLGHMEISGKQSLDGKMEYYLRIPWKMVTQTASSRLFGKKEKEDVSEDQIDEIQYGSGKTKYVNVKIVGDENGYKFSLAKDKRK